MTGIITRVLFKSALLVILWLPFAHKVYGQDAEYYYQQFRAYREVQPDSALYFAKQSILLSQREGDSLLLTKALNAAGYLENKVGNYSEAIHFYLQAYDISKAKNYKDQEKFLTNNLGLAYNYNGNYDESLKYHLLSLQLREQEGNSKEIAITRNNLGLVYYNLNHYKMALDNFILARNYFIEIEDVDRQVLTGINIGLCYKEIGDFESANKFYLEVEQMEDLLDDNLKMQLYSGLGDVNYSFGEAQKALEYFDKAQVLAERNYSNKYLAIVYHNKAIIYYEEKDLDNARLNFLTSLQSSEEPRWIKKNYRLGANIEEDAGNFEKSLEYYKMFMVIQDSILNEAVLENVQNLQLGYAEQEHARIQSTLDMQIAQNRKINMLLGALLLSVGFIAFFSYRASKVRKDAVTKIGHAYQLVERQKDQLEKMVEERTVDLKQTNEELANFIYRTSHDIRGPLATLKGVCNVALLDIKDKDAIGYLQKIDATSSKLINILSRIQHINSIKNYVAQNEVIKLKKFVDKILDESGVHEDVSVYNDVPPTSVITTDASMLQMCLSNIINNAFKFRKRQGISERPFVKIKFLHKDGLDIIQVVDNGAGILPENINKIFNLFFKSDPSGNNADSAGIGLHLAKLAIMKVGGDVNVVSVPGQHTCFTIEIPQITPGDYSDNSPAQEVEKKEKVENTQ